MVISYQILLIEDNSTHLAVYHEIQICAILDPSGAMYGYSLDNVEILTDQKKSEIITIVLVERLLYLVDYKKDIYVFLSILNSLLPHTVWYPSWLHRHISRKKRLIRIERREEEADQCT